MEVKEFREEDCSFPWYDVIMCCNINPHNITLDLSDKKGNKEKWKLIPKDKTVEDWKHKNAMMEMLCDGEKK